MTKLFIVAGLLMTFSAFAQKDLSQELRLRIESRIIKVIEEETKQACNQELFTWENGVKERVPTGGMSVGLSTVIGIYKTKCGQILIRSKVVGASQTNMRKITVDFDSNYELYNP